MNEAKHTPGPLEIRYYVPSERFRMIGEHVCVARPDGTPVALCGPTGDPVSEADARLFRAAPDLLQASLAAWHLCMSLLASPGATPELIRGVADALRAAVDRAHGG